LREYAPLASTISSTEWPTAPRAVRTRIGSAVGIRPTFIFTRVRPCSAKCAICSARCSFEYEVKPPLPYTGTLSWKRPSRSASETPSRRAFRSHSATSTAEIAIAASPGWPTLRTVRHMAAHADCGDIGSLRRTAPASVDSISSPAAASA
jgi:hypothetical protein